MAKSRISEAYVQLIPTSNGFITETVRQLSGVGPKISQEIEKGSKPQATGRNIGSKITAGIGGALKMAAIGVAAGAALTTGIVGAIGAKAISGGISRALNIEDAQAKLKGLGYSGDEIKGVTDATLDAIRGTSFALDETVGVAATALAAGVPQGEGLTKYLKTITDTATITGGSIGEIGSIFNKVQAGGKAYTAELQQLQDRGLPVFSWLQEEYGQTAEAMKEMVSNGEVDAERLFKVINEKIGGAALQSGDTTRGAIANANSALSRLGAGLVTGSLPFVKDFFNGLIPVIDALTEKIKPMAEGFYETFGPSITAGMETTFGWLTKLIEGGGEGESIFSKLWDTFMAISPIANILSSLTGENETLLDSFMRLADTVTAYLGPVLDELVVIGTPLLDMLMEVGTEVFDTLIPAFGGLISQMGPLLASLAPVISTLLTSLIPVVQDLALAIVPVTETIIDLAANILEWLGPSLDIIIGMIPTLIASFTPLIDSIVTSLVPTIGSLVESLSPLIEQILETGAVLLEALLPHIGTVLTIVAGLASVIIETLGPAIVSLVDWINTWLVPSFEWLGIAIADILNGLEGPFNTVLGWLIDIGNAINPIIDQAFGTNLGTFDRDEAIELVGFGSDPKYLASGGIVNATPGGVNAILAEGGRSEAVTDAFTLNQLLSNTSALASRAENNIQNSSSGTINNEINIYQQPGETGEDLYNKLEQFLLFNSLNPPGYSF